MAALDVRPARGARLLGGLLGLYGAALLGSGVLARALGTFAGAELPAGGLLPVAVLVVTLIAGAATLLVALRAGVPGGLFTLGPPLLAVGLSVVLAGWGLARPVLAPAALESAGGAALLAAAFAGLARAARKRMSAGAAKAHLVRAENRTALVAVDALGPGDRVRVAAGETLPVDGALAVGEARFEGKALGLPAALERRPGDPVFAGSSPDAEVDVDVGRAARDTLLAALGTWRGSVGAALGRPTRVELGLGMLVGGLALLGLGLRLAYGPEASFARALAELSGLALAALVGLPALVGARRRRAAHARLADAGLILTRAADLGRLTEAARFQIDPRLVAGPGEVEVVAFDDTPKARLLALAAALYAERQGSEAVALARAARDRGAPVLRGAGFAARGELVMGTVSGARWHIGPRAAMERSGGLRVPRSLEGTLGFLAERGHRVLLLASPDRGLVAALGLKAAPEPGATAAARRLGARLAPGLDDEVRRPLAHDAGLELDDELGGKSTCVLLHPDSPPPAAGLAVRVMPLLVGLELGEGAPRLWAPSLPGFPEALEEARAFVRGARGRSAAALAPPLISALLLALGFFVPALGALLGGAALAWAVRVPPRPAPATEVLEEELAVDVTLSGIEVAAPAEPLGADEDTVREEPRQT